MVARVLFGILALLACTLLLSREPVVGAGHMAVLWAICWIAQKAAQRHPLWIVAGLVAYAVAYVWLPIVPLLLMVVGDRVSRRNAPRASSSASGNATILVIVLVLLAAAAGGYFYRASLAKGAEAAARESASRIYAGLDVLPPDERPDTVALIHRRCFDAAYTPGLLSGRVDESRYAACVNESIGMRLSQLVMLHSVQLKEHSDPLWWILDFMVDGDVVPPQPIARTSHKCDGQSEANSFGESPIALEKVAERRYRGSYLLAKQAGTCRYSLTLIHDRWSIGPTLEFDPPPPPAAPLGEDAPAEAQPSAP